MERFKQLAAGLAVCGFALAVSIGSAWAADDAKPSGYPWTSKSPTSKSPQQVAKSQAAKMNWVARPIPGRTTKTVVVTRSTATAQAAPRPGKPALAVSAQATENKTVTPSEGENRTVAYQTSTAAPALLAQHKTDAAQPVIAAPGPIAARPTRSVVISQKTESEALPAPLEIPAQSEASQREATEEEVFEQGQPILSLLAPPWARPGRWEDQECCTPEFCPLGTVFCMLGRLTDYAEFTTGMHAFQDPVDMGTNSNFGINYGVNLSGALFPWRGIGYQAGANLFHSDLSGHNTGNVASTDDRLQIYTTVGLFRRQLNTGLQFGVVWDWRHDEFYDDYDVHQVRGELSFKHQCADEFGIWFTANTRNDTMTRVGDSSASVISTNELYAFFYRKSWECGGEGRLYSGFSGESDTVIGGDFRLPVSDSWAVEAQATYLIPNEANGLAGTTAESWGLGINMVWTPKCSSRDGQSYPFRALLPVASPASMMGIFK